MRCTNEGSGVRRPVFVALLSAGLLAASLPARSLAGPRGPAREVTAELRLAVKRGFRFLLREHRRTDSYRSGRYPVAMNALFGLAVLTSGHTLDSGEDEDLVRALRRSTSTLLSYQNDEGYFDDDEPQGMYGHGFATLFLAEAYGMSGERGGRLRSALRDAVGLIERSQRKEGGWDYLPDGPRGWSDTSITVCQTLALRAARNLGVAVDAGVIRRARAYIEKAQKPDGSFRYTSSTTATVGRSPFPRSAAGVCILFSLGAYDSRHVRDGLAYLEKHYREFNEFPFYAQYYCSQALYQAGGRRWREYFDYIRGRLLEDQRSDGAWRSKPFQLERHAVQTTSMALLVLQLPWRYLPIHER